MGHLFQAECWVEHPRGCSFGCLSLRKLANKTTKAVENKNGNFRTFIYKNNGN